MCYAAAVESEDTNTKKKKKMELCVAKLCRIQTGYRWDSFKIVSAVAQCWVSMKINSNCWKPRLTTEVGVRTAHNEQTTYSLNIYEQIVGAKHIAQQHWLIDWLLPQLFILINLKIIENHNTIIHCTKRKDPEKNLFTKWHVAKCACGLRLKAGSRWNNI